ncbi:hypothetical protein DPMN_088062 [Dreissena polymorpha]|uniref:Uncharacterized protein n=1 Tax=Dreissena polymorpha TaxID=45954 RepID=A0A9D4KV63_DREPO|nr:hypothetical protein DPMN_088045 [Dreissena polymorpha]KAH3845774.1 hypothetical protein DPMN_088062 [Dreissena polymorpha]
MSTDGGLQWYWVIVIVLAVLAVSSVLCLIWCCKRPKRHQAVPSTPPPDSPRRFSPLPSSPGIYRPSFSRQWSKCSTKSQKEKPKAAVPFIAVA